MRLGSWGADLSSADLESFIDGCVDMGLVDFDHADIYGHYTEEGRFGDVMRRRPDLKAKLKVTTKCGIKLLTENRPSHKIKSYDSTREHIIWSADNSLQQLGVDRLDVLLLHRPDFLMHPDDIAEAFSQLRSSGKVLHFGVSNFSSSQFELLHSVFPLVTHQVEISPLHRSAFKDGTLDQCLKHKIIPTAWSPYGGGRVFNVPGQDSEHSLNQVLTELSKKYDCQRDQLILAWLRKHPSGILPILGTTKIERISSAHQSLSISLTHEDWYRVWEAAEGKEVA